MFTCHVENSGGLYHVVINGHYIANFKKLEEAFECVKEHMCYENF